MSINARYNEFMDKYKSNGCDNLDDTTISNGTELLKEIKTENSIRINQLIQLFLNNPNNSTFNMKNVKDNYDFREEQDKTTKLTFLEKYLFLIVKIIFFIVLLLLLFMRIRPYLSRIMINNTSVNKNVT